MTAVIETQELNKVYEAALRGRIAGHIDWLTPVHGGGSSAAAARGRRR